MLLKAAPPWRALLKKPVFIGVTGSVGKTTTKELLLGVLGSKGRGIGTVGSMNNIDATAQALLRLRRNDNFFVAELSEDKPGVMNDQLTLLRPSIGIVTVVGNDHWSAFGSREAIADEMRKLIASLPLAGSDAMSLRISSAMASREPNALQWSLPTTVTTPTLGRSSDKIGRAHV